MNPAHLSKILAVVATIVGLLATQADMVPAKWVPVFTLVGLACAGTSQVFKKFAGNWAITAIGAGIAITSMVTPYLITLTQGWAHTASKWCGFLGIALATVGKGFFGMTDEDVKDDGQKP